MKWLLITTRNNGNTGDELIRIGVQNLIKEVDPKPEFELIDKERDDWEEEREFDKAVLCGMPLFWNNKVSTSQNMGWWGVIMDGWVSKRKEDFLILGVGSVVGVEGLSDSNDYLKAIEKAIDCSFAVTTRNYLFDNTHIKISHPHLIDSICPAAFSVKHQLPKYKICNLMDNGAHDEHFDPVEAQIWRDKIQDIAKYLIENDYYFIEHSAPRWETRQEDGLSLGFPKERVICFDTAEEYIPFYANARQYVGNRIHGAVMVACQGLPTLAIGYESRLDMAARVGAKTMKPSEVTIEDIEKLSETNIFVPEKVIEERKKLITLLKDFSRR